LLCLDALGGKKPSEIEDYAFDALIRGPEMARSLKRRRRMQGRSSRSIGRSEQQGFER
jgi:hypothetical protein